MVEIEVPLEKIQQDLEHAAHGGHHDTSSVGWVTWSALLSALLAVLAAVAALQAGHQVNEAMVDQMKASDTWNYYQAKGIKHHISEARIDLLTAMGKEPAAEVTAKLKKYEEDQKALEEKARKHEEESESHFHIHETFATSVTFFQIAIAVTAIAVLARRKKFLGVSGVFGLIGLFYLFKAFLFT